jgi:hypothetical protein
MPVKKSDKYCQLCKNYFGWDYGCDLCKICQEEEEKRKKEEEIKKKEEEEKKKEEAEEENAQINISELLKSIASKVNGIDSSDFKINTDMINKKRITLRNKRVNNLKCQMNKVEKTDLIPIDTELKKEIITEDKSNYLYEETEELSLENLKILNSKSEKIKFSKKF